MKSKRQLTLRLQVSLMRKDDIMKKRTMTLIFPFIALIFEVLPYGAVLNFANPDGEPFRKTFSYFDLTPFGYANFAPLITALLTCIILLITPFYIATGNRKIAAASAVISALTFAISLTPIIYGAYSLVGVLITLALALGACLFAVMIKKGQP